MKIGKDTSGTTLSVWFDHLARPTFPTLDKNLHADVCIIGAGISGLTLAYQLVSAGKSVIVLEDGRIGSGETGRTTGHLTNMIDDRYLDIIKVHGEDAARLATQSHMAAIDFIEEVVTKEKLDCDFMRVDGYLFPAPEHDFTFLQQEYDAAKRSDCEDITLLSSEPPSAFSMKGAIKFGKQAQFHPLKYLTELAKKISEKGGQIFELTHVIDVKANTEPLVKTEGGFTVKAEHVVMATNVPVNNKFVIHTKQEANRTYVIGALIPKDTLQTALFWDTGDPYYYLRIVKGNYEHEGASCDLLLVGGADHRTGASVDYQQRFSDVENWTKGRVTALISTPYRWSGQIIEPVDYLSFIGHNPLDNKNIYVITGDSGNGLTHGTLAAILLADFIANKENAWTQIYRPARKSLKTWREYLTINLKAAASYLQYLTSGTVSKIEDIPSGHGAIVRQGLKKLAVYRDAHGKVHACSAVCPHLQSLVNWNPIELSWDCPAHGSRFTVNGEVINGPALHGLTCETENKGK